MPPCAFGIALRDRLNRSMQKGVERPQSNLLAPSLYPLNKTLLSQWLVHRKLPLADPPRLQCATVFDKFRSV